MKKIVLAIATVLLASGTAFAGSDNYGTDYIPGPDAYPSSSVYHSMGSDGANALDLGGTKSIGTANSAPAPGGSANSDMSAGYGQGIWGH
ncbi:hypothetical protein [Mesorhizobium sp. P5_C1]